MIFLVQELHGTVKRVKTARRVRRGRCLSVGRVGWRVLDQGTSVWDSHRPAATRRASISGKGATGED